jgi:hypothetical protein
MLQEERTELLLNALYKKGCLNSYDFCIEEWGQDEIALLSSKAIADELVDSKLAKYNDVQKTELVITNFGKYWVIKGGYLIYLKEGEKKIKQKDKCQDEDDEKDRHLYALNEELKEARLKFTNYRIVTFWWSFGLTLISFLLSLFNLYMILGKK